MISKLNNDRVKGLQETFRVQLAQMHLASKMKAEVNTEGPHECKAKTHLTI